MNKKRNQVFVYLYALAIIMVVDDHCGTQIGILSKLFPYNSFYMPLFVFSSGYFFRLEKLENTIIRRVKRILIPYILYDMVMIIIAFGTDHLFHTHWFPGISLSSVRTMIFEHPTTSLNDAAWFAIMLFWVSVIYSIIQSIMTSVMRWLSLRRVDRFFDSFLTVVLIAGGFISIYLSVRHCNNGYRHWDELRWLCRTAFFLQFYHLGYMFKCHVEPAFAKWNKGIVCLVCITVNLILIVSGNDITFISILWMSSFNSVILPLVTSTTGIFFWYEVMSFLSEKIGETRPTSFIAIVRVGRY